MTFDEIMENEGFEPNQEQRPVIESTRNTVVSAGAGAGKTAVLSWRFLRLVLEEHVKPEEILTLTFTNKAASEMRERIYRRLIKAKDSLPADSLESFGRSTICTLDSFFAQIVRSDSITYGLPRDISNMSDDDLSTISENLALKFLKDPGNREQTKGIASLVMPKDLMEAFFGIIAKKVSLSGDYDALRISEDFHRTIVERYRSSRDRIRSMLEVLGGMRLTPTFQKQYDHILECFENESFTDMDYFKLTGIRDEEVKDIVKENSDVLGAKADFATLQNLAKSPSDQVSPLQVAVERYAVMLNEEKRRRGLLTFNDISDLAVVILRDNLGLRNIYKKRYRFIMIDEFQDNNSRQRDLLFLLSERYDVTGTAGVVPSVNELEADKLFFVGDEKQSIYRFRGADVSVFRGLQDDISGNGNSLSLSTNYRSQRNLIDHFNEVFRNVLSEDEGQDYEARFSPILAGRKADGTKSRIVFGVYNSDEIDSDDPDAGILEAEAIGDYCDRILNTDEFIVDGKRPGPSDIAIIFRTTGNQMNIEKSLKRRGIGYQIAEAKSLMLEAVASDFYSLLNSILYPYDSRSWAAALKSPFCGLCERSILNLQAGLEVIDVDRRRYSLFTEFFDKAKDNAFRLSLTQLLEYLYIQGGYKAYLQSNKDRRTFIEHYDYLYSYADRFESEGRGLADFTTFLRDNLGSASKLPEVNVLHQSLSGVQMMTVHKSKGLEFKVVIFAGLGTGSRNEIGSYVFEYGGNLIANEQKTILRILEKDRSDREKAEQKRVMYVALTRAKDHLILVGGYKLNRDGELNSGNIFKWYANAIGFDASSMGCGNPNVEIEDLSKVELPRHEASSESFELPSEFVEFCTRQSRLSVSDLKRPLKANDVHENPMPLPIYDVDALIGHHDMQDKFGTLCHLTLEALVRRNSYSDVECSIMDSEKDNQILLSRAKDFADSFVASPLYRRFVKDRKTETELRFYSCLDESSVEGVIDLLCFGKDYNLVIDYKSDRFKDPLEHKSQVLLYLKAARQLYGLPCYGILYYLRDGSTSDFWDENGDPVEL